MTKWIADGSVLLREVAGTRQESHNAITGLPVYNVRLEVPNNSLKEAIAKLLGNPESWPHDTGISNVKAISANLVQDLGEYNTDADAELVYATNPHLIDVTYTARPGVYGEGGSPVHALYVDDNIEPRIESRPMDFTQIIWGANNPTDIPPVGSQQEISADTVPSQYFPGEQLSHVLEGWLYSTELMSAAIGTVNNTPYTSLPLDGRLFAEETLLLRNIIITKGMTFNSYKLAPAPNAGLPTFTIRMIYEYKAEGWQKFWRVGTTANGTNVADYYYLRHKSTPFGLITPSPPANHTEWLF